MRIDFHLHLAIREQLLPEPARFCDGFWGGARGDWNDVVGSAEALDAHLEAEGVDYAVGLAETSPKVTGTTSNEFVLERFGRAKRVIRFANLNPWVDRNLGDEVRRLDDLGFKGIKLYPTYQHFYMNDPSLYGMYDACQERGWPVMAHTGSSIFPGSRLKFGDPLYFDDVVVDFPDLKMLIVHGGRGMWYEQAMFLAQFHKNIYLEVAGLPPQNLLKYFPNLERISRKVVFGSDWPANPGIRKNMEEVMKLNLSDEAKENILGGNAARILNLPVK